MGKPRRPGRGPAGRVLAGLLLVLGVLAVGGSRLLQARSLESARSDAEDRAVEYADAVVAPLLSPSLVSKPISGEAQDDLLAAVGRSIRNDAVARLRIWAPSGELLFTTDKGDQGGETASQQARAAGKGSGRISSGEELADVGTAGEPLYRTLVPMRIGSDPAGAVVQVDQRLASIDEQAREPAATVQTAGIAAAVLGVLLGLVWMIRGRTGQGRAGGFQASPAGSATEPEQPAHLSAEAEALAARLEKAESARQAVEQQLEQLRGQIARPGEPDAERAKALEAHVRETEERARQIELRLREAEDRLQQSDRVAKEAVQRAEEAEARAQAAAAASSGEVLDDPRVPQLEAELAAARDELGSARSAAPDAQASVASTAELDGLRERAERAEQRAAELEQLRSADQQRLAASADVAETASLRIRELEGKLEGSSRDREAVVSRLRELEEHLASVQRQTHEGSEAAADAAERANLAEQASAAAEARATTAEQQLAEAESRIGTLQELVRSAEERAATAGLLGDDLERRLTAAVRESEEARAAIAASEGVGAERARLAEDAQAQAREATLRLTELEGELEATRIELEAAKARAGAQEARLEDLTARTRAAGTETEQAEAAATEGAARARELDQALREAGGALDGARAAADEAEARAAEATARANAAEEAALAARTEVEELRSELAIAQARREPSVPSDGANPDLERELAELRERAEGAEARLRQAYSEVEAVQAELEAARSVEAPSPQEDVPMAAREVPDDIAAALARIEESERRVAELEAELASVRGRGLQVEMQEDDEDGPSLRYRLARSAAAKRRGASDPDRTTT